MPLIGTRGAASVRGFGGFNVPEQYWIAQYDIGGGVASWTGSTTDTFNNFYTVGAASTSSVVAKYNVNGVLQWTFSLVGFGSTNNLVAAATDLANNIYYVGTQPTTSDIVLVKLNDSGAVQWGRSLSSAGTEAGHSIAVNSAGDSYVVGYTTISSFTYGIIAKYNTSGTLQWQRKLGNGSSNTVFYSVALDSSSNAYVTGENSSGATITAKYNASGTIQWQRALSGSVDSGRGITVDSADNAYVVARAESNVRTLVCKYNTSGALQWQKRIVACNNAGQIAVDISQNIYVVSQRTATETAISKFDSAGSSVWNRRTDWVNTGILADNRSNSFLLTGGIPGIPNSWLLLTKLPYNGTRTGVYSSFNLYTYDSLSPAIDTPTRTDSAGTLTDSAGSLTSSTITINSSGGGLNYTLYI